MSLSNKKQNESCEAAPPLPVLRTCPTYFGNVWLYFKVTFEHGFYVTEWRSHFGRFSGYWNIEEPFFQYLGK